MDVASKLDTGGGSQTVELAIYIHYRVVLSVREVARPPARRKALSEWVLLALVANPACSANGGIQAREISVDTCD